VGASGILLEVCRIGFLRRPKCTNFKRQTMAETQRQREHHDVTGTPSEKGERLAAYLAKFEALKERRHLREVVERDMLLEFLRVNHSRIDEYPLLPTQQASVIEFLCRRSVGHPGHDYIQKPISQFLVQLNLYRKATKNQDEEAITKLGVDLGNLEMLLLKCAQGVVFSLALTLDNLAEVLVELFGDAVLDQSDAILKEKEFDEQFWKAHLDDFFIKPAERVYAEMVSSETYKLARTQNNLVLRFAFDDVRERLHGEGTPWEKTRLQQAFEDVGKDEESLQLLKLIQDGLPNRDGKGLVPVSSVRVATYLVRIVCLDPVAKLIWDKAVGNSAGGDEKEAVQEEFLREQALAVAMGAGIAVTAGLVDFSAATTECGQKESDKFRELIGAFEVRSMRTTFFAMLECSFLNHLRERAEDEGGKILVKSTISRRIQTEAVEELFDHGLTKIRRNKLWQQDPNRSEMLQFKSGNAKEFTALLTMLQITGVLEKRIQSLWEHASPRVDIFVLINMALVAKSSTNLNKRLMEILAKFGVGVGKKEGPARVQAPAKPETPPQKEESAAETPPAPEPPTQEPPAQEPAAETPPTQEPAAETPPAQESPKEESAGGQGEEQK
jgi:hypothetical protein